MVLADYENEASLLIVACIILQIIIVVVYLKSALPSV